MTLSITKAEKRRVQILLRGVYDKLRYGVDTRGFNFSRLPKELAETDTQAFKGELGSMRDVLGEIQSEMYKSMEKNKPAKSKEQER